MAIVSKVNENDNGYEKSKSNENDKKNRQEKVKLMKITNENDTKK